MMMGLRGVLWLFGEVVVFCGGVVGNSGGGVVFCGGEIMICGIVVVCCGGVVVFCGGCVVVLLDWEFMLDKIVVKYWWDWCWLVCLKMKVNVW